MTDPDERIINRSIALLGVPTESPEDEEGMQDIREQAREALHRLFNDRRRLERRVQELEAALAEEQEKWKFALGTKEARIQELEDIEAQQTAINRRLAAREQTLQRLRDSFEKDLFKERSENARLEAALRYVAEEYAVDPVLQQRARQALKEGE